MTPFACEARACGSSVQWANRIFGERLLYGTEVSQRYRAFRLRTPADDGEGTPIGSEEGVAEARLLIYASARSSDRQYLRVELLWLR